MRHTLAVGKKKFVVSVKLSLFCPFIFFSFVPLVFVVQSMLSVKFLYSKPGIDFYISLIDNTELSIVQCTR